MQRRLSPVAVELTVPAATAVVGYDLMRDNQARVSALPRAINGIAVAGSLAAGDCSVDLFIGQVLVGRFFNKAVGWPTRDHRWPLQGRYVPPGETIALMVSDAPATNPINVILD